jgi:enediyne biosynthesis protein E4
MGHTYLRILTLLLVVTALVVTPAVAETPRVHFTNVTETAGIRFRHSFGDDHMSSILEATGSGCAFLDADQDGRIDLYAVSGGWLKGISDDSTGTRHHEAVNRLFHNRGDGTFEDVTRTAGVGDAGYGMGAVAADYDNDGAVDLYVTNYGTNRLLQNRGKGVFADVTSRSGTGDEEWGVGAVWLDQDLDGDLDLFVGNYLEFDPQYRLYYAADAFPGPLAYPGQTDVLYRNDGDGTFVDIAVEAGVAGVGRAMGVASADVDADGWPDLFVANDAMGNFLYRNKGGAFEEVALSSGVAFSTNGDASSSMGADFSDIDGDGDVDLFVPDMAYNNLYLNDGTGWFEDRTAVAGVAEVSGQYVSWHGEFLDVDNDGDRDLFISNGSAHYVEHTQEALLLLHEPLQQSWRYTDVSGDAGPYFRRRVVARGAAAGDYDDDGDLDLFVVHLDQPSTLLRNEATGHHWLQLLLRGTQDNRDGIGAHVRLRTGDLVQSAQRTSGAGYLSQSDPRLHFGLGDNVRVDSLEVRWPGGTTTVLVDVAVDRVILVTQEDR